MTTVAPINKGVTDTSGYYPWYWYIVDSINFSNRGLPSLQSDANYEWLQYVNISIGFERIWFSKFSLNSEPFYRFPLGEHDQFRLLSKIGVILSINYTYWDERYFIPIVSIGKQFRQTVTKNLLT